jgi:pyridoxal phosphate enzyme (YggS family)
MWDIGNMVDIAANLQRVMEGIQKAAARCHRDPSDIKILAATKSRSPGEIEAAIQAGVKLIGENYVQEGGAKKRRVAGTAEWHMIGHLQRNKAKAALDVFSMVQSVDSVELARALNKAGDRIEQVVRVLIEVNLGAEPTKSGVEKEKLRSLLEEVGKLSHLRVEGLMVVPPLLQDPEEVRPYFQTLKQLQLELSNLAIPNVALRELSMGMTHDYPVAVEEGATIVRIGTAIFGKRKD